MRGEREKEKDAYGKSFVHVGQRVVPRDVSYTASEGRSFYAFDDSHQKHILAGRVRVLSPHVHVYKTTSIILKHPLIRPTRLLFFRPQQLSF